MFGLFGHSLEHLGVWDLGERCPPRSQPPGCVVMGPEHVLGTACKVSTWIIHICNLFMIIARYYMSPGTGRIRVVSKERAPLRGTLVRVGSVNKASIPRPSPRLRGSAAAAAKVRQRVSKNSAKKSAPQNVDRNKFAYWICTIVGTCKSDCVNMLITWAVTMLLWMLLEHPG
jgi:hypothetical protein